MVFILLYLRVVRIMASLAFTVLNGNVTMHTAYCTPESIRGVGTVLTELFKLCPYVEKGVFSMDDIDKGIFSCNFLFLKRHLNIYGNKGYHNAFSYIVTIHDKHRIMNREDCLTLLIRLRNIVSNDLKKEEKFIKRDVLVDVDGTLVDYHKAIHDILLEKGVNYKYENLTNYYGCDKNLIGCDWKLCRKVTRMPRMYDKDILQKYKGVDEGLELLRKVTNINGYTGSAGVQEIYLKRYEFCKENHLIPNVFLGEKPVLQGFHALFDDNPYLIENWLDSNTGTQIYMIEQPYNKHIILEGKWEKVNRCKSFYHAVKQYIKDNKYNV